MNINDTSVPLPACSLKDSVASLSQDVVTSVPTPTPSELAVFVVFAVGCQDLK